MNRLARIAEGSKAAQRYANHSNSGGSFLTGLTYGGPAIGGAATSSVWTGMTALVATLATENVAGRLLSSPRVANVLAQIGGARTPQAAQAGVGRLSALARSSPVLAEQLSPVIRALNDNLAPAVRPMAASQPGQRPDEDDERRRRYQTGPRY